MCKKGGTKLTEIDLISQQILTHEKEIENNIQVWLPALLTFGASVIIALLKLDIQAMSCEDIRLNIIKIMENKTTPDYKLQVFDYEKDYYYHKCEIPLREEVIKLQKDGLQ